MPEAPEIGGAYNSPIDPQYQQVLQQYLGGQLSPAQMQYLQQQREQGLSTLRESYGGRGAPAGAQASAQRRFLSDSAMQESLLAGQQQQIGLQQGLPYMQMGAQNYYRPQELELQRYGLQLQDPGEQPWYMQALGAAGGLLGDIATPGLARRFGGGQQVQAPLPPL